MKQRVEPRQSKEDVTFSTLENGLALDSITLDVEGRPKFLTILSTYLDPSILFRPSSLDLEVEST